MGRNGDVCLQNDFDNEPIFLCSHPQGVCFVVLSLCIRMGDISPCILLRRACEVYNIKGDFSVMGAGAVTVLNKTQGAFNRVGTEISV